MIQRIKKFELIGYAYLLVVTLSIVFGYILFPSEKPALHDAEVNFAFVVGVLAGPIIETYLVQHLLISYSHQWLKRYWPGLLLSILVFAVLHHYSVPYMVKTLLSGTVYGLVYMVSRIRSWPAIWYTCLVHMLHNFTAFVVNYLLNQ